MPGRLGKLENAISKQRTVKFNYWSISRDEVQERTLNPYALLPERGVWYVIGHDLDRDDARTFRVSRIRGDIRFATRRERDFRIPADFDVGAYRDRPTWQIGDASGEARIEVSPATAWWVERAFGTAGTLEGDTFVTPYSSIGLLASWILRQDGRAVPAAPGRAAARGRPLAAGDPGRAHGRAGGAGRRGRSDASPTVRPSGPRARSRPSASASSRRCSRTCSPPAATGARRRSRPTSSSSGSTSRRRRSRSTSRC